MIWNKDIDELKRYCEWYDRQEHIAEFIAIAKNLFPMIADIVPAPISYITKDSAGELWSQLAINAVKDHVVYAGFTEWVPMNDKAYAEFCCEGCDAAGLRHCEGCEYNQEVD